MYTLKVENKYGEVMELTHNSAYVITSIDGIDPPQAVINTTRNASADGSVYNSAYVDNRTITITLAINESAEDNRINLYRYFKPKYPVKLYYKNEERDVYIAGYVQNMPITFFNQKQIAQITIICPDPFFVGAEEGVTEFSSVESLFEFPFNIEEAYNILPNTMESETIGGVLFTVNADKTVEAVGSSSDFVSAYVNETGISLEAGTYVLYGCAAGGSPSTYRLQAFAGSAESPTLEVNDYGAGASFELTETTTIKVRIYTNGAINELFKPMIFTRDALEYGTASGSPAHFTDGSDNALEECETEINAVQDLHGYDKPWAGGAGKNKCFNALGNVQSESAYLYPQGDGLTIAINNATRTAYAKVAQNTDIVFSCKETPQRYIAYGLDDYPDVNVTCHSLTVTQLATNQYKFNSGAYEYIAFYYCNDVQNIPDDVMIEQNTQATTYEPYSNICPIVGQSEVNVSVNGVNQWDEEWINGYIGNSGQIISDGNSIASKNYIPVDATKTYYGVNPSGRSLRIASYREDYSWISNQSVNNTTFTLPSGAKYIKLSCYNYGATYADNISINYPSTETDYHKYGGGSITTIPLGREVYGGTLNVKTGLLTDNVGDLISFTSDNTNVWSGAVTSTQGITRFYTTPSYVGRTLLRADSYKISPNYNTEKDIITTSVDGRIIITPTFGQGKTLEEFKALLVDYPFNIEMTLATPQTYQLTKAQVRSIVGENYIDSDTGEIEVKYIIYTDIDRNYQKYGSGGGVEFSVIIINRETNVYNGGDVETGAVITLQIEGVVKDPKIYNVETNEYFILDDLTLQDGDVVTINTVKKQKSVTLLRDGAVTNLIGKVRFGSTWFQLFPLDNTFIATAELYPENMLVTFTISNLFEGV